MNQPKRTGTWSALLLLLGTLTGCNAPEPEEKQDISYLLPPAHPVASGTLLPAQPGAKWFYTGNVAGEPIAATITVLANANGRKAAFYATQFGGNVLLVELASGDGDGVRWLGNGTDKDHLSLSFDPPIPRLVIPIPKQMVVWHGTIIEGKKRTPGEAICRMKGPDTLKVPAGEFAAYRSDVLLTVKTGREYPRALFTRWYVPGIGAVREDFAADGKHVTLELKQYVPAAH